MDELAPGTELGGYRIEAVAGRGGMGVVYRAMQLALQRRVALKVIAPEYAADADFRARFKRESLTAAAIEHPNVITVHDAREENGVLFLTMRYVEGTDLREAIRREGSLEPHRVVRIVMAVASALDAAHAAGLVHRDVKPANILLAGSGAAEHVFLTDFGLSKQTSSESGMTRTGMFVGTLDYVAPEQLRGGAVDARTDVYSLACVLYQALTGVVPYPRDSDMAKMFAHASEPPPSVRTARPDLASQFDAVVAKGMAKDPIDRYPSAGDLGRAAVAAAHGQEIAPNAETGRVAPAGTPAFTPTAPAQTAFAATSPAQTHFAATAPAQTAFPATTLSSRSPRRKRLVIASIGAAGLAIAVLAVVLLGGGSSSSGPPLGNGNFTSSQQLAAEKWAGSHYPGAGLKVDPVATCNVPAGGIGVGGTIDCVDEAGSAGTATMKVHVTSVPESRTATGPFTFGPIEAKDCTFDVGDGQERPCD